MAIINVSGAGELMAALNDARPGDTLRLASGDYGSLNLDGDRNPGLKFAGDVTITSANPGAPAVFRDVSLREVANLNFENVDFTAVAGRTGGDLVSVSESRGITINNADFDGHQIGGKQNGLSVNSSSDVQISNSEFADFYYGAGFRKVDNLRILNNDIHSMDFDGLRLAQVTDTLIQGNRLHDMDGPVDGGHRDMIQFWNTDGPSANVTIRGNTIDIGDGRMIQSLFVYNEAARAGAGEAEFHRNFLIENNHIEGVHPHGILVGETLGLTIRGNTVVRDPDLERLQADWEPIIEVAERSKGVTITGNTAHEVPNAEPGWNVGGNRLVPLTYQPGPAPPACAVRPDPGRADAEPEPRPDARRARRRQRHAGRHRRHRPAARPGRQRPAGRQRRRGRAGRRHRSRRLRLQLRGAFGRSGPGTCCAAATAAGRSTAPAARPATGSTSRASTPMRRSGNQAFGFGGTGAGQISVIEFGNTATLVRGNTDDDAAFEFELIIEDAGTRASAYTAADFIL